MNFLNPLFLLGLAAAALPVIIHLINRQRAVKRRFPAIEFLRRSQKKLDRRLKVRNLILLLLRIAALVLVPLGLARPYLLSETGATDADRLPRGVVFVVDDSASMAHGDGATWTATLKAVGDEVDRLRTWDRVSLVYGAAWPAGAPLGEDVPIPQLVDSHGDVMDALEDHAPTQQATDLVSALRTANGMLTSSDLPNREIVLITDRQLSGFDARELEGLELSVPVRVIDVRAESTRPNLAVVGAEYRQQSAGNRPEFELIASVRNFGERDAEGVEVGLVIDGVHASSSLVNVPAGKTVTRSFTYTFEHKGRHNGEFRLGAGADELGIDNVYHFPIHLDARVRALLVNGDRRSVAYQDELFYLEHALQPGPRSTSNIVFDTIGVDGIAGHPFSNYDVVLLANVEKLPRASVVELRAFVERGGGLLFTMGDKVKAEGYNSLFGELLPKPLRSVKLLAEIDDPDAPIKITRFGPMERSHPVFKVFDLPGGESIGSVRVFSYMLLEPTHDEGSQIVLSYSDGAPALLERPLGEGHVAMLTTTIDRDWTDLPIRTAYLPLMRRYLRYLARRGASSGQSSLYVANKVSLDIPTEKRGRVEVRDPDNGRIVLAPETTDENAPLSFVPRKVGPYSVRVTPRSGDPNTSTELDELAFAVNIDPTESDLRAMPLEELQAALNRAPQGSGEGEGARVALDVPERRLGLWSIALFIVTLVLLAETILGTRRSVLLRLWYGVRGKQLDADAELARAVKGAGKGE